MKAPTWKAGVTPSKASGRSSRLPSPETQRRGPSAVLAKWVKSGGRLLTLETYSNDTCSIRWELSTGGAERLPLAAEGDRAGGHCAGSQFLDQTCSGQGRQCCSP